MKPASFAYLLPASADELCAVLARYGDSAKILAGGQSLVPMMNLGLAAPSYLVDINRVTSLEYVRGADGVLSIGALTRHTDVKESAIAAQLCPLLRQAYEHVAHRAVRNRGTLGGNLAHADPASEMPAVALALDAEMIVASLRGSRSVTANDFFKGTFATVLASDEYLAEIRYPAQHANEGSAFVEVSARKGDFAYVGVAARIAIANGTCSMARLTYCGVGDRPLRITEAEQALVGTAPTPDAFARAAKIARSLIAPPSSFQAPADYRKDLVSALTRQALEQAAHQCGRDR